MKPSNFTLTILVKLYGREHRLDKAFEVVEELPKKHGFAANCHVLTCLISASLANGRLDRAMEVFNIMRSNPPGHSARPDTKTFTSVINGLMRHGKILIAADIIKTVYESNEKEIGIENQIRDSVVRQLRQKGLHEVLVPMTEAMRKAGIYVGNDGGNGRQHGGYNGGNRSGIYNGNNANGMQQQQGQHPHMRQSQGPQQGPHGPSLADIVRQGAGPGFTGGPPGLVAFVPQGPPHHMHQQHPQQRHGGPPATGQWQRGQAPGAPFRQTKQHGNRQ